MNTATTPTRRADHPREAERERIWFFGGTVGVLVTGDETDQRYAIVEQHLPAGTATPLHVHRTDEESFVVLMGARSSPRSGTAHRPGSESAGSSTSRPACRMRSASPARATRAS